MKKDSRCKVKYSVARTILEKYRPGERFRAKDVQIGLKQLFYLVDLGYLKHNVQIGLKNVFECEFERTDKQIDPRDFRRTRLPISVERLYVDYGDGQWHPITVQELSRYKHLIPEGIIEYDPARKAIRLKGTLAEVIQEVSNARHCYY